MQSDKTYDLFISHAWDSEVDYYGLIDLLGEESSLDWRNQSVPRSAPVLASDLAGIREALARRIYQSDAVLVVSDRNIDRSKWISYELNVARELHIPIIGIEPWRVVSASMELQGAAITMVSWKADSIAQSIKSLAA